MVIRIGKYVGIINLLYSSLKILSKFLKLQFKVITFSLSKFLVIFCVKFFAHKNSFFEDNS